MDENGTQISGVEAANKERAIIRLWQMIGAHKAASQIASSLGAQSIRALEMVRDSKDFLATGFQAFDKFLDQHPDSPMTHEQFRRRANLLNNEGDIAFDLLNSLNVPLSHRKLLAGKIEVTENEIKIGDDTVRLDDSTRIVELISKLHKKDQEQQRTIARKDKQLAQGEKDNADWKRRAITANPDGTETGQALLTAAGSLSRLRDALEAAPDEEKLALKEAIFHLMSNSQLELSVALGIVSKDEVSQAKGRQGDNDFDEEAAALMEEL
jgi:hypothetical protein